MSRVQPRRHQAAPLPPFASVPAEKGDQRCLSQHAHREPPTRRADRVLTFERLRSRTIADKLTRVQMALLAAQRRQF
jgi:hypothetical protein